MSQDRHLGSSNKRVGHPLPENQKMASRALRRPGASRFADRRGRLLSAARASPSHSPDPQAFSIGQDREGRTQGPLGADQHNPGVGGAGSEQVAVASGGDSFPPTPVTRTAPGVQGTCWSPPRSALHSKGLAWPHGQRRPEVGPPHPGKARLRRTQAAACAQGTVQVKEHVLSWWERGPKSVKTHPSVLSQTPARWPCMGARSREGSLPPLRPAPPGLASAWQGDGSRDSPPVLPGMTGHWCPLKTAQGLLFTLGVPGLSNLRSLLGSAGASSVTSGGKGNSMETLRGRVTSSDTSGLAERGVRNR